MSPSFWNLERMLEKLQKQGKTWDHKSRWETKEAKEGRSPDLTGFSLVRHVETVFLGSV